MTPDIQAAVDDLRKIIDAAEKLRERLFHFDSDDMEFKAPEASDAFVQFDRGPVFPVPEQFRSELLIACKEQHELRKNELLREAADFLKGRVT